MTKKLKIFKILFFLSALVIQFNSLAQTSGRLLLNVKNNNALGNGIADDTNAIQATINGASPGDTVFIPKGVFIVKSLGLKSGIHLKSEGILKQKVEQVEEYSMSKQNSSIPLLRGKEVSNIHLSIQSESMHEAIYLSDSKDITISHSTFIGDATKLQSFSGIMIFRCQDIVISHTTVCNFGMPRTSAHNYQPGTGIRILTSKNLKITDSDIRNNGENGVFIHNSQDVSVQNTSFRFNGMSAIQVAFGSSGNEKNYSFINNIMEFNAADAIDINNRSPEMYLDINCLIKDNVSRSNGFVNGKSTPDGSGIATLINVSGVSMLNNTAEKNNRPAIYLESCGIISAENNRADNQVEIVLRLEELKLLSNEFGSVNLLANVKAGKLTLGNNKLGNLSLPNGIRVDSMIVANNVFTNASLNFNMEGEVQLINNKIIGKSTTIPLLIVNVQGMHLEKNKINSSLSGGIVINKTATNITIVNNTIQSLGCSIYEMGSVGLLISGNKLTSIEGGKSNQTLISDNPNQLRLFGNQHIGSGKSTTILFKGKGTATVDSEIITKGGLADYGSVKVVQIGL